MADDQRSAAAGGEHLDRAILRAFGACRLGPSESREVVRHLLGGCRACAEGLRAELAPKASQAPRAPQAPPALDTELAYDAAIDRAIAQRLTTLRRLDAAAQCRELLAAARELRDGDPRLAAILCTFGLAIGEAEGGTAGGTAVPGADVARLWAELGNAWRIGGDLQGAESAFAAAHERAAAAADGLSEGPSGGPPGRPSAGFAYAEILELHGWLRHDQGRFAEAAEMLGWAQGLFEREPGAGLAAAGRAGLAAAGRAGMARGIALGGAGEPAAGMSCLLAGLEPADLSQGALLAGFLHLGLLAVACGRPALGRSLARFVRRRGRSGLPAAAALAVRGLEGELAAALSEYLPASRALREARDGFEAMGRPRDALQIALALAVLELDHGRASEAERLVSEALAGAGAARLAEAGRGALERLASALRRGGADAAAVRATAIRVKAAGTRRREERAR